MIRKMSTKFLLVLVLLASCKAQYRNGTLENLYYLSLTDRIELYCEKTIISTNEETRILVRDKESTTNLNKFFIIESYNVKGLKTVNGNKISASIISEQGLKILNEEKNILLEKIVIKPKYYRMKKNKNPLGSVEYDSKTISFNLPYVTLQNKEVSLFVQ